MAQLIAALITIHRSVAFLADMYCFLDPSGAGPVWFPVDDWCLLPVDCVIFLNLVVGISADLLYSVRLAVLWLLVNTPLNFDSTCGSVFLEPYTQFSSSFSYVGLITVGTRNPLCTFCYVFFLLFVLMNEQSLQSLPRLHCNRNIVFLHNSRYRFWNLYIMDHDQTPYFQDLLLLVMSLLCPLESIWRLTLAKVHDG